MCVLNGGGRIDDQLGGRQEFTTPVRLIIAREFAR